MKTEKQRSLSVKMNVFIIVVILLISGGLVTIAYQVYRQKINSIYFREAEVAALDAKKRILPGYVDYFWDHINTDEFRNIRKEAIAANDESLIRNWMDSVPSMVLTVMDLDGRPMSRETYEAEGYRWLSLYDDYMMMIGKLTDCLELFDISAVYIQSDEGETSYNLVRPGENLFYVGSIEDPIEAFSDYGENESIPATIYHSPIGWLCSITLELDDAEEGKIVGTVGVDIDVELVVHERRLFLVHSAVYVVGLTVAAIFISMFLMKRFILHPLEQLSKGAAEFAIDNEGLTMDDVLRLPIDSKDEIGDLYRQIQAMQSRIVHMTQITAERERVKTELNMAERIQRDMLPAVFPAFPEHPEFDLYASMTPAREVGGDFYDFFLIDDTHLAILIADVSGKGVPAALFMMASMIIIRSRSIRGGTPAEILTDVNTAICKSSKSKMFVTVWMGILDLTDGRLVCSNAGHEYPFIRSAGREFRLLRDKHGLVLGGMENTVYQDYELKLEPGDAVFTYTDGVPEANNTAAELYGLNRLGQVLNRDPKSAPQGILERVKADVDRFAEGTDQFDDLTMLCIEYKGSVADMPNE